MTSSKDIEFCCPLCGDFRFGSSIEKDGKLTRHCHGEHGCNFSFSEDDDWKYWQLVEKSKFESREEFEQERES